MSQKPPSWLTHKPIISVDYSEVYKNSGDAKFLTLGRATWNHESFSAKIWRRADEEKKWSRQSEELPLGRLLDLTRLFLSAIYGKKSGLGEEVVDEESLNDLNSFIKDNMELYLPQIETIKNILQNDSNLNNGIDNQCSPNIFSFATSELSQDAILAYILQWADSKYKKTDSEMYSLGQRLLRMLIDSNEEQVDIRDVEVGRQWKNIDVYVKVNGNIFLVIEDKINTTIHDNQLERYKKDAETKFGGSWHVKLAYIKTGNEPSQIIKQVVNNGYKPVLRKDLLTVLNQYRGKSPIIKEFNSHLQAIESRLQSFKIVPMKEWNVNSFYWQGLYMALEEKIEGFSWKHVPNKAGGFWGAYWSFLDIVDGQIYLQIESGKFCFKLCYWGQENKSDVRNRCFRTLQEIIRDQYPFLHKPSRFGAGTYMTFMVVEKKDLFGDGVVNIDAVVTEIKKYENLLKESQKKLTS
jgi:hypothetical protein